MVVNKSSDRITEKIMDIEKILRQAGLNWPQKLAQSESLMEEWKSFLDTLLGENPEVALQSTNWEKMGEGVCSMFELDAFGKLCLRRQFTAVSLATTITMIYQAGLSTPKTTDIFTLVHSRIFLQYVFQLCGKRKAGELSPFLEKTFASHARKMVLVPEGKYRIGNDSHFTERPMHFVSIKAFKIGVFPVTQGFWLKFSSQKVTTKHKGFLRPVEKVSWYDAIKFCNALSKKEGRKKYYKIYWKDNRPSKVEITGSNGYRLPTEAEWEVAARSGSYGKEKFAGGDDIAELGWCGLKNGNRVVGLKKPNEWGLFDMSGNVLEWCWDYWEHYDLLISNTDPLERKEAYLTGPLTGKFRVYRGGSWNLSARYSSLSCRLGNTQRDRIEGVGLRLACDL